MIYPVRTALMGLAALPASLALPLWVQCPSDTVPGGNSCATALVYDLLVHGYSQSVSGSGAVGGADEDWFQIDVAPQETFFANAFLEGDFGAATSAVEMVVANDCSTPLYRGPVIDWVSEPNLTGASQNFRIGFIDTSGGDSCALLTVTLSALFDQCRRLSPDALEPNDDVASGVLVGPGDFMGLTLPRFDSDVFLVDVPRWSEIRVSADPDTGSPTFPTMSFDLFDAATGAFIGTQVESSQLDRSWVNAGQDTRVAVRLIASQTGCASYDLRIGLTAMPCGRITDDPFEAGDECGQGTMLAPGTYHELLVDSGDPDALTFQLAAPALSFSMVHVDVEPLAGQAAASFALGLGCVANPSQINSHAFPGELRESLLRAPGDTTSLEFGARFGDQSVGCLLYDLTVTEFLDPIGTTICGTNASRLELWGSDSVGDNILTAVVSDSGPIDFPTRVQIFVGSDQVALPTAARLLCAGGTRQRIFPPCSTCITSTLPDERMPLALNLGSPPSVGILLAGTTWTFQGYYGFSTRPDSLTNAVRLMLR